ncbi:hypothetical protein Tco_0813702 [Tanacetum coccineum]
MNGIRLCKGWTGRNASSRLTDDRVLCRETVKAKNSPYGSRAWNGDLGIGEEVVTWKLYLGLAFTVSTLERVTIGCFEVSGGGGGGGRVTGGVGVVCGDGVDSGVGGVVCGVVCFWWCLLRRSRCGQGTGIHDDCKRTRER